MSAYQPKCFFESQMQVEMPVQDRSCSQFKLCGQVNSQCQFYKFQYVRIKSSCKYQYIECETVHNNMQFTLINQKLKQAKPIPRQHPVYAPSFKYRERRKVKSLSLSILKRPAQTLVMKKLESMPMAQFVPHRFTPKQDYSNGALNNTFLREFSLKSKQNRSCRSFRRLQLQFVPKQKDQRLDLNSGLKSVIHDLKTLFRKFEKLVKEAGKNIPNNSLIPTNIFSGSIQQLSKKLDKVESQYLQLRPMMTGSVRKIQKLITSMFHSNQAASQMHYLHPDNQINRLKIPKVPSINKQSLFDNQISFIKKEGKDQTISSDEKSGYQGFDVSLQLPVSIDPTLSQLIRQQPAPPEEESAPNIEKETLTQKNIEVDDNTCLTPPRIQM